LRGALSSQRAAEKNVKEGFGELCDEGRQSRARAEGVSPGEA